MANDYSTNSSAFDVSRESYNKNVSDPAYASFIDYPESLTIGDRLFPMLYIYYMGNTTDMAKVGNPYKFEKAMVRYIEDLKTLAGVPSQSTLMNERYLRKDYMTKFRLMFDSVCKENTQFVWMVANAASTAMSTYNSRLDYDPERPLPGSTYYRKHVPETGETTFSSLPSISGNIGADIGTSMEALRILFENDLIKYDYDLGIRPINLFTGELSRENDDVVRENISARYLGLPTRGVFTTSNTKKGSSLYHTFSGIDINALASLDSSVSELNQLLQMSWSIHRGTTSNRTLGKPSPGGRVKGGRTIAGTMIFAMTDHHPLRDVIPDTWGGRKTQILNDPESWKPLVMADEIPPFDLVLTLSNEYGFAAVTTLYGVQVADEGGVFGMDNLITELAIQYTAMAMDPIMEAKLDDNGVLDPFGILQGGYSKMWRKRELVAAGAAYSDLEAAYERYYDSVLYTPVNR